MQIPKVIKIGPYDYNITYPHHFEKHENCRGRVCYTSNTIQIDPTDHEGRVENPYRVWQTLFHEVVHAACDLSQIEISEQETDRLATTLFTIMTDNDWLLPEADMVTEAEEPDEDTLQSVIRFLKHHKNLDIEGMLP
jgi:hypothetical protein